jgi:hypothetical protein
LHSAGMWMRRVGVTAGSRQIGGQSESDTPQVVSEMAAPQVFRTPASTAAEAALTSADGSVAMAQQRTGRRKRTSMRALRARMRRCLILGQGASPLRPPAPFPWNWIIGNRGNPSRVRKPRARRAPLTDSRGRQRSPIRRERGPRRAAPLWPPVGRLATLRWRARLGRALTARLRRCLKLRQGTSPQKTPPGYLTGTGLIMEDANVCERSNLESGAHASYKRE